MSDRMPLRIAFAGLGAMGFGMANHLVKQGHEVTGFDVYEPSLARFKEAGGLIATTPRDAAENCHFFVCMVANAQQVQSLLFDAENAVVPALRNGAVLLLCSTVSASYAQQVEAELVSSGRDDIFFIDSPVSGGTIRAAKGTLSIFAAGSSAALEKAKPVLAELADAEKLYVLSGGIGAGSNVKMSHQVLAGIHIAASSEAMALAAEAGLNTREVYNIITSAAGNSWMFQNRVPHMLDNDPTVYSAMNIITKDMGIVMSSARQHGFPVPLSAAAEQLYIQASAHGMGRIDDSNLVRLYIPQTPLAVHELAQAVPVLENGTSHHSPICISKIGFIGLGSMGQGMASSLLKANFPVHGFDVYHPSVSKFQSNGGTPTNSPSEAAAGAQVLIVMVQNALQVEDTLFGSGQAAQSLPHGSIVILSSTVPASFVLATASKLSSLGIHLVDAPVSGGVAKAAAGELTIIASGPSAAISAARPVLSAMSGDSANLHHVEGGAGRASSIKMINQMLAGVHIAAAAEAMAFGAKLGLNTTQLYEICRDAAGGSWMFENRVPAMLKGDWTPHSALAIMVKDLAIVLDEAKKLNCPAPLSAAAHQLYLMGAAKGWSHEADSGVVRVWELMTGGSVSESSKTKA